MSNQAHINYTYHIILSYTKNASFKGRSFIKKKINLQLADSNNFSKSRMC